MHQPRLHQIKHNWNKFKPTKENLRKYSGNLIMLAVLAFLFGSLFLVAIFGYYSRQLPDIHSLLNRYVAQSTKIYDRTGETLLWEVHGDQKRTVVELDQISEPIKWAIISAEDKNFYQHKGFSILGIMRAAIRNLLTDSTQGGSTITQQMIKNTYLTTEKTFTRKIKELIMAREAEKTFNKEEILKIYLNTINYGGVNYGVESASQAFFGKSANDIGIAEAAILAAVPQAPTRLSPYGRNTELLFNRQHWVIDRMVEEKYITKDEGKKAKEEKIEFKSQKISNITAPHFVFYVTELVAEQFGEEMLNQGGLKIITTLDLEKQKVAEESVVAANEGNLAKGATDAALVSLDAKTGEILAMVGSQDYFNKEIDGEVNVSIEPRQPGSSIKPIVYAAALAKGFTPETVVYDVNTNFAVSGKAYAPKNYDLKERGPVTFRQALQGSLNIPAVKAMYLAGVDNVMKILSEDLQYSTITKKQDCGLSLVLGGCEVTLLDHAQAYTAFARDGEMAKSAAILEIKDSKDKKIFEFKATTKKAWESQTVRQLNNILTDNAARAYVFGERNYLTLGERPVAAKTGTTNDYNDAWTIGYTPSFVTGVWVGNADGTDMKGGADGSVVAAPIWNAFMRKILEGTPVETFKAPDPLPEDLKLVLKGVGGGVEAEIDRISGKLATEFTPVHLRVKTKFQEHHNILHYLKKNDPRGPAPENPSSADPAYDTWEAAVQDWVTRQKEKAKEEGKEEEWSSEAPPTEYDDIHHPQYNPSLTIVSPTNLSEVTSLPVRIEVSVDAPKGISRVEYQIDDQPSGVSLQSPYGINLTSPLLTSGFHKIKITAYDSVDNLTETTLDLNFKLPEPSPNVIWQSPRNNGSFYRSNFPLTISMDFFNMKDVSDATLKYEGGVSNMIGEINTTNGNHVLKWAVAPVAGTYNLFVEFKRNGETIISDKVTITIQE